MAKYFDQRAVDMVAGRNVDAQLEHVRLFGNHGLARILRQQLLESLGIPPPRPTAENLVMFGCYTPFSYGSLLRDYLQVLDILGVPYTYLDEEVCCGAPIILTSTGVEREKALAAGREFARENLKKARQKGARNILYCCVGCAHTNKGLFPRTAGQRQYLLDPIVEGLGKRKLKVAPKVAGYFEGCHSGYRAVFPQVSLQWAQYRRLMDRIEGLRIVDIPNDTCCKKHPERIIETAEKQNLDTILCPCNGCYYRLGVVGKGKVQVKHLVEIILQGLKGE